MYLEFFKFNKDPFDITPDPDFLFLSPSHKESSASIFYGIQSRKGLVAVTGEVGVGKTTVLRSYVEGSDPEKIRIVYIFNSAVPFDKLLKQICFDLGIQAEGQDQAELVDTLFRYLMDEYRKDHNVVLVIDEAQNMPVETLEQLRVLTNLETSRDKLIQIILAGQPELEAKLELAELRHLKQRIAIQTRVQALTADESIAYIYHRLMRASSFHNPVFTKNAMKQIIKQAGGVPRTINILCDNALVTAFGYLRKPVDEKIVKEVIRDFLGKRPRSGFNRKIVWASAVVACLAAAFFVSANLIPGFQIPPRAIKHSVGVKPADPLPVNIKAGRSEVAHLEKKGAAVAAVKPDVKLAAKPNTAPAAGVTKLFTKSAPEDKTGAAVADVRPAGSSKAQSAPAASASLLQKASVSLSAPAGAAQPDTPPALAPRQKEKSLPLVTVRKGDSVSRLLRGVYGRVDDDMLKTFRDLNPQVKNMDKILVGEKIILPQVEPGKP